MTVQENRERYQVSPMLWDVTSFGQKQDPPPKKKKKHNESEGNQGIVFGEFATRPLQASTIYQLDLLVSSTYRLGLCQYQSHPNCA